MVLKLQNTVTKKEYEFDVTDLGDSRMYYHFNPFVLEAGMDDGSYEYTLFDKDNEMVATGVLQVGDFVPTQTTAYTNNNNTEYIQYNG